MKLVVTGDTPSKKNGKNVAINRKTGRLFPVSNPRYLAWEREAVRQLTEQFKGFLITDYPIALTLTFYFKDKRLHDLDNCAGSVMDSLKLAGIIEDDSYKYINKLVLLYGGLSKDSPRVEIDLED